MKFSNALNSLLALLLASMVVSTSSFAATPTLPVLLSRLVEFNGNSTYSVEQDVVFTSGNDTVTFKESWVFAQDESSKLTLSSPKVAGITGGGGLKKVYRYADGKRFEIQKSEVPVRDFFTRIYSFRKVESLGAFLVQQGILPNHNSYKKLHSANVKDFEFKPDGRIRPARTAGMLSLFIGPVREDGPALWLEQENNYLLKFRTFDGTEIAYEKYPATSGGLFYPRSQTVKWKNGQVSIAVTSSSARASLKTQLNPGSDQNKSSEPEEIAPESLKPIVREFFERFR